MSKPKHPNPGVTAITYGLSFLCGMATFGICKKYNLSHTTSASLSAMISSVPFSIISALTKDDNPLSNINAISYKPLSIAQTALGLLLVSCVSNLIAFGILNKLNTKVSVQEPILSLMCGIGLQATWSCKRMIDKEFAKDNHIFFAI